jgi:hypothetical protein
LPQGFRGFAFPWVPNSEGYDETIGEFDRDTKHFELQSPIFLMQKNEKSSRGVTVSQGAFQCGHLLRTGVMIFAEQMDQFLIRLAGKSISGFIRN